MKPWPIEARVQRAVCTTESFLRKPAFRRRSLPPPSSANAARAQAKALGLPDFEVILVEHPIQPLTAQEVHGRADAVFAQFAHQTDRRPVPGVAGRRLRTGRGATGRSPLLDIGNLQQLLAQILTLKQPQEGTRGIGKNLPEYPPDGRAVRCPASRSAPVRPRQNAGSNRPE